MFLLFGRGGPHGRILLYARLGLVVAFLLTVVVFHPHGTELHVLQGVRVALIVALLGFGWYSRRQAQRAPASGDPAALPDAD